MKDKVLLDIIKLALEIEKKASGIFNFFSMEDCPLQIKKFWNNMSNDEKEHIGYWKSLLKYAENGLIPQIIEDPLQVKNEFNSINARIDLFKKQYDESPNIKNAFLVGYRLEFYMLNPAFEVMFHFLSTLDEKIDVEESYDNHIRYFINGINKFNDDTPELALLGETIDKLWNNNKILALQSSQDVLMGILNRRGLFHIIRQLAYLSVRNSYSVGILMIDIDDFKNINDKYGHQKGDDVLKYISNIIKSTVRKSDVVGRYGGEEILVFLMKIEPKKLDEIAENIRSSVELQTRGNIPLTISIGTAIGKIKKDVDKELNNIINLADKNLYKAKETGKNRVVSSD